MGLRSVLISFMLAFYQFEADAQVNKGLVHTFSVSNTINDSGRRVDNFLKIDSAGNIFNDAGKTGQRVSIRKFSKAISDYVFYEKIKKYPGDNRIIFTEYPTPELNKQHLVISIIFLNDFLREKNLRNKTTYSQGHTFELGIKEFALYKYLSSDILKLFKDMMQ